jgi:hypothetical protein
MTNKNDEIENKKVDGDAKPKRAPRKERKKIEKQETETDAPKKTTPKNDEKDLGLITNLIKELDDNTNLILRLSQNNYYNQYVRELEYQKLGYEIRPYIDKEEFFKKMNK